jgi:hypothetical protein
MITEIKTFTVQGWNGEMDPPLRVFQTVFFPKPTKVVATACLSAVSTGRSVQEAGTAGASIWKVGLTNGRGGTDTHDLSQSFLNSGRVFDGCVFVTFVLSLRMAAGVGLFTVSTHG